MTGLWCLVPVACTPQEGEWLTPADAGSEPDVPAAGGTGGRSGSGGAAPAGGGAGGQTVQGGGGGPGGAGGRATGGSGGASGQGGSTRRDAGADATGRDARAADDAARGVDGGPLACDDKTSPGRLGVYYYSSSTTTGSSIQMNFDVVNFTAYSAQLSQVTIRYWFTDEEAASPNQLEKYYVPLPTTMRFLKVDPPREGADTVLELSFAGAGDAGASFVETRGFNFAFHKESYAGTYDQGNDYSYDADLTTALGQNPRITAYVKGELAWGCEPPLLPPPEPAIDGGSPVPSDAAMADAAMAAPIDGSSEAGP